MLTALTSRASGPARAAMRQGARPSARAAMMRRGGALQHQQNRQMGNAPPPPPFVRTPKPTSHLHEEHELVWEDGVVGETAIDFDAPMLSKKQGILQWLGGFAFFGVLFAYMYNADPYASKPTAPRQMPYDNLTEARGGYGYEKTTMSMQHRTVEAAGAADAAGDDDDDEDDDDE